MKLGTKDRDIFLRYYSHYCFTHECGRHIKRYTFEEVLKRYNIPSLLIHIIYNIFDIHGLEQFDWREMGFMLFTICRPNSKPAEDLEYAFKFFTGNGLVDIDAPTLVRLRLQDVEQIFSFIVRPSSLPTFLDLFYSRWGDISSKTSDIMGAINQNSIFISVQRVTRIIKDIASQSVLPNNFEEKYFPFELVRLRRSMRLMKYALNTISITAMEIAMLRWKEGIHHQKIVQVILYAAVSKVHHQTLNFAFIAMRKVAVQHIAIVELQSHFRGHVLRSILRLAAQEHSSAILLQAFCRGMLSKPICRNLLLKRGLAATHIQRSFRGYLGRAIAKLRSENATCEITEVKWKLHRNFE